MATLDKFDLSEFSAQGDEVLLDIPVCIPKTAFRIHPHKSHMLKAVFLKRSDDHWYLIHPDVVRSGQLTGLWKAALYEGVKSNGASFILPLTNALPGREERTDSLREAIDEARQGWVMVESDAEQDRWITMPQNSKKLQSLEPKWFDGELSRLIEIAFRGRIIRTQKEASAQFRKTSRREITEDE
jgi:hypothetical protein